MMNPPVVVVEGLSRRFKKGVIDVPVFSDLNFTISPGEFVAIVGPSGSGKSTMLNLLAGFDKPNAGAIRVGDRNIVGMNEKELGKWRLDNLGFIFQSHNLVSLLTAIENVEIPLRKLPMTSRERRARAEKALDLVGLADRKTHFPNELSGGEEQRVAVARAIVTDPRIILADEPTGNLDASSAQQVMQILQGLNLEQGKIVVLVTHDQAAARFASRQIVLRKGVLERVAHPA